VTKYRESEGSFDSRESANDFINRVLESNKDEVDQVGSGAKSEAILDKRFGYPTGYEAYRSDPDLDPSMRKTYGVRVLIRNAPRREQGYRVHTAFPVNEYRWR
jgi:hypothetical protein